MTDDLVTFIRARLDEDEDYARQAFADHNEVTPDWTEVRSGAIEVGEHEDEIITFDSGHLAPHGSPRSGSPRWCIRLRSAQWISQHSATRRDQVTGHNGLIMRILTVLG